MKFMINNGRLGALSNSQLPVIALGLAQPWGKLAVWRFRWPISASQHARFDSQMLPNYFWLFIIIILTIVVIIIIIVLLLLLLSLLPLLLLSLLLISLLYVLIIHLSLNPQRETCPGSPAEGALCPLAIERPESLLVVSLRCWYDHAAHDLRHGHFRGRCGFGGWVPQQFSQGVPEATWSSGCYLLGGFKQFHLLYSWNSITWSNSSNYYSNM